LFLTPQFFQGGCPPEIAQGRRFGKLPNLQSELAAWSTDANATLRGVDWQMKVRDARGKLKSLYPKTKL
jgi:hypothetical protein